MYGNGYGYNTPNQYHPLLSAKDHCVKNSEALVNNNLSKPFWLQTGDQRQQQPKLSYVNHSGYRQVTNDNNNLSYRM